MTLCNKEGAVVHAAGIPALGSQNVCASTMGATAPGSLCCAAPNVCLPAPDTACTCSTNARPFHECEVFKIDNLAGFYLDSIAKKASLYFRNKLLREGLGGPVPDGGLPDGAIGIGPGGAGAAGVGVNEQSSGIGVHLGPDGGLDDTYNARATPVPRRRGSGIQPTQRQCVRLPQSGTCPCVEPVREPADVRCVRSQAG